MFKTPAKKIRSIAKFLFWFALALAIFSAVANGFAWETDKSFYALPFFTYLIGYSLSGYVIALLMHGFANVIDNTRRIATGTTKQNTMLENDYVNFRK